MKGGDGLDGLGVGRIPLHEAEAGRAFREIEWDRGRAALVPTGGGEDSREDVVDGVVDLEFLNQPCRPEISQAPCLVSFPYARRARG